MIANKIIPKLSKAIEKYGVNVEVYRSSLNDFGEKIGDNTLVSKFKGLYSESNHSIDKNTVDAGAVKKDKIYKLIALIDSNTDEILEGDKAIINSVNFEIVNISNANMIDAYYEFTLKRY